MIDGPVVAAVDGSDHSLKALEWAVAAAGRHHAELVVAHVLPDHVQLYAGRREALGGATEPPDPIRALVPEGARYRALEGAVPVALRGAAEGAGMLVMGSRGRGGFASLLLGSTSRAVSTTAACPVVVVPHDARTEGHGAAGPGAGAGPAAGRDADATAAHDADTDPAAAADRVVLGLHAAETADEVIAFAFAEAAARRAAGRPASLRVVSAYAVPPSPLLLIDAPFGVVPPEALPDVLADTDRAPAEREMLRSQGERLAPYRTRYPDLPVDQVASPGDAAGLLVQAGAHSALVVVGRHHRRLGRALLMGSVANAVLTHTPCAVAVVPAQEGE
ncbi:universal stress protein [Streptomyces sp. NPDC090022]|uniref:universal stress protein n=1 Tax=Streptomyces sp. NPDC090022 TaxID=3365920 RepID=UPI0037FC860D